MTTKNGINQLKNVFKKKDFQEEVEFETNMLALTFLSEVEKEADLKGIKRKELAKLVGTSASYITQIMRGNKVPNLRILTALGLALGKKFDVNAVECVEESRKAKVYCNDEGFKLSYLDLNTSAMHTLELSTNIPEMCKHEKADNIIKMEPKIFRKREHGKICS